MAKIIVSGNLNVYGNAGQFESDRSTWGFADSSTYAAIRWATEKSAGLYSARVTRPAVSDTLILPYAFTGTIGKFYIIKAKVFVPSYETKVGADASELTLTASLDNFMFGMTEVDHTNKTVLQATDTWVDVEISVEVTGPSLSGLSDYGGMLRMVGAANTNGKIYIDQFEIYEYVEGEDGEPEPPEPPDETDDVFLSKNPIVLGKAASIGWEAETNYRLYNDVRVEDVADSGTYNSKLKTELPPDSDGNVVFYLNEAFRDAFSFTPPTQNQNTIVRLTDRIKRFKNFSGELSELEVTPSVLTESDANLVLFGGIDKFNFPGLNYLTDYLPTNKKFLTWAPTEKYVDRLQEDYLNFWVYDETIATLKLRVKAYFDDDTDETDVTTSLAGVAFRSLYQIPAGPVNSGATLVNPAKNITKYELTILNQDDVEISEVRTYYVTLVRHPLTRFFMFLNSLGTFEVLRFTGQAIEETSFSRDLVQKFLPHNYNSIDGEFAVNNNTMDKKNSYSSGHIKDRKAAEWHEYLQDFLLSSRVYDVTTGARIPFVMNAGNYRKEDQNYQRFIRFEGKPAYDDQSYTPSRL